MMIEPIGGHSLGSIGIDDKFHTWDECPNCGEQKIAASTLCKVCHCKERVKRQKEIKALVKNLIRAHQVGETLIFEANPDVDFKQAIRAMVTVVIVKREAGAYTE